MTKKIDVLKTSKLVKTVKRNCITLVEDAESFGEGCDGIYYRLTDTIGLKVHLSDNIRSASEEFINLQQASLKGCNFSPIPFLVVRVKMPIGDTNLYYWGVLMEHVDGVLAGDFFGIKEDDEIYENERWDRVMLRLSNKLEKLGIYHDDLHPWNVIRRPNGRYVVIDFATAEVY